MGASNRERLHAECLRIEEDTIFSAKTLLNDAERLAWRAKYVQRGTGLIGGLTAMIAGGAAALGISPKTAAVVAAAGGFASVASNAFKYDDQAQKARSSGNAYLGLNKRVRFYRQIELPLAKDAQAETARVKGFIEDNIQIQQQAPECYFPDSWTRARDGIRDGETEYSVDKK